MQEGEGQTASEPVHSGLSPFLGEEGGELFVDCYVTKPPGCGHHDW